MLFVANWNVAISIENILFPFPAEPEASPTLTYLPED
jgi:hypothetical protein